MRLDARLQALQRSRRRTIDRLRALDLETCARRLEQDPLAPILDPRQLARLEERRRVVLDHVDRLVGARGETSVYAW